MNVKAYIKIPGRKCTITLKRSYRQLPDSARLPTRLTISVVTDIIEKTRETLNKYAFLAEGGEGIRKKTQKMR